MNPRVQFNPACGFRHVSRSLGKGEVIPPLPSLFEQLVACHAEMIRQAQEEAAAQEVEEVEFEPELEDAV